MGAPAPAPPSAFVSANTLTPPPGLPSEGLLAFSSRVKVKGFIHRTPVTPLQASATAPQPRESGKSKKTRSTPTPTAQVQSASQLRTASNGPELPKSLPQGTASLPPRWPCQGPQLRLFSSVCLSALAEAAASQRVSRLPGSLASSVRAPGGPQGSEPRRGSAVKYKHRVQDRRVVVEVLLTQEGPPEQAPGRLPRRGLQCQICLLSEPSCTSAVFAFDAESREPASAACLRWPRRWLADPGLSGWKKGREAPAPARTGAERALL